MAARHQRYNRAARCAKKPQQRYAVGDTVRYVGPVEQTMLAGYGPGEAKWRRVWTRRLGKTGVVTYVRTPKKSYSRLLTMPTDTYMKVKFADTTAADGDGLRANQVEFVSSGGGVPEEPRMVFRGPKYQIGQQVLLAEFDNGDEIIPEESGIIEDFDPSNRMYLITVDDEYLTDEDDDGIREVTEDQIKGRSL